MRTDLISRGKLRIAIQRHHHLVIDGLVYIRRDTVLEKINMAPSVKVPQANNATWEVRKNLIVCSGDNGCYEGLKWHTYTRDHCFAGKLPAFCPFCGAKMDGGGG